MSDQLSLEELDKLQEHFEGELKGEEEKEQMYKQQAEEITTVLCAGKKVNDGYYTWTYVAKKGDDKITRCTIVAARNMLFGQKGYTPMFGQFELNEEIALIDNLREAVVLMLKKQNGEYVAEVIED